MILNQIMRIGEIELGNQTEYEVLVDNQKVYKKKKMLVVPIDTSQNSVEGVNIYVKDYDDSERYLYGRGITAGNSICLSPTINIKWQDVKTEEIYKNSLTQDRSVVNLRDKLVKMTKHPLFKEFQNSIIEEFYLWLEKNHEALRQKITKYIFSTFIQGRITQQDQPGMLIFQINNKFPGEYKTFRKLYKDLSLGTKSINEEKKDFCYVCGEISIISTASVFNMGFFTLDHSGFGLHFLDKKKQTTLQICSKCTLKLKKGLTVLEKDLRFFAYLIGKGRNKQSIHHYIIPLVNDPGLLKDTLKQIHRAKQEISTQRALEIQKDIEKIKIKMESADLKRKNTLRSDLKKKNAEKTIYEEGEAKDIEIAELIIRLGDLGSISYLDLYFKETDLKQSPTSKEIVALFHITKKRFERLSNSFKKIKNKFNLPTLRLWPMQALIGERQYPTYLQAIFGETFLDKDRYLQGSYNFLKRAFLAEVLEYDNLFFSSNLRNFQMYYDLFEEIKIWRK